MLNWELLKPRNIALVALMGLLAFWVFVRFISPQLRALNSNE